MGGRLVMVVMRYVGDCPRVDHTAEDQQADRESRGIHMASRSGHGYGNEAERDVRGTSRSTT